MKLLRTDTNFRTEPEFKAIGKSRRRIDIYRRSIHLALEAMRIGKILRHNRFRMSGIIPIDMSNCFIDTTYDFNG